MSAMLLLIAIAVTVALVVLAQVPAGGRVLLEVEAHRGPRDARAS